MVLNHLAYEAPLTKVQPAWFHHRGPIKDWSDPTQLTEGDVHGLPDFAVEKPEVQAFLNDAIDAWVESVHPDGLRLDAVKHIPLSYWSALSERLHQKYGPNFYLLGEDLEGDPIALSARWRAAAFDAVFDFPLLYALKDVACEGAPASRLAAMLSMDRVYDAPHKLVTLLDNHDLPRIRSACKNDPRRVALALRLLFSLRGTPSLLYGTEVGLAGSQEAEVRQDMRFEFGASERHLISALMAQRRSHGALAQGETWPVFLDEKRLVLLRASQDAAEILVIGINLTDSRPTDREERGPPTWELSPEDLSARLAQLDPEVGRLVTQALKLPPSSVVLMPLARGKQAERLVARLVTLGSLERPKLTRRIQIRSRLPKSAIDGHLGLFAVGSDPSMGAWSLARALEFNCDASGACRVEFSLPAPAVLEWKLVLVDGEAELQTPQWEAGPNRSLLVERGGDLGAPGEPTLIRLEANYR